MEHLLWSENDGIMVSQYYYDDTEDTLIEYRRQVDIDEVLESNKLLADDLWVKGIYARPRSLHKYGRLVARVPLEVWEMWQRLHGIRLGNTDQKTLRRFLNDPDNAAFRVAPGRL